MAEGIQPLSAAVHPTVFHPSVGVRPQVVLAPAVPVRGALPGHLRPGRGGQRGRAGAAVQEEGPAVGQHFLPQIGRASGRERG